MDDNKISRMDRKVVDNIIMEVEKKCGKMTVTRGKEHVFVGMDIKFINKGRVIILMKDYLTERIEVFETPRKNIINSVNTPAKKDLFNRDDNENLKALDEEKADTSHHIVSKLLYISKRERVDIDLGISYLYTWLLCSTDGD